MKTNRSMPASHVIPVLTYSDVGEAVEWLCKNFGFSLRWRVADHRAQLNAGDGCVAITKGADPDHGGHSVMVRIEDVAAHHANAEKHGVRIIQTPTDFPYGERQYTVEDLAGHIWTFSQTMADVAPEDWGAVSANL